MRIVAVLLLFVPFAPIGLASPDGAITTGSLIGEMTDMVNLTRFPDPHFKTVQFSSYDRRSTGPYQPGWFANADGFGREPIPGFVRVAKKPGDDGVGTYVMVDVKGPGAIVRTWTAMIRGTIRLVLDNSEKALYDGPAQPFLSDPFTAIGGSADPNGFNQREAGYFPIPFSTRCLILWTGKKQDVHFYQIQVRCYEKGTKIQTFTRADLRTDAKEIAATAAVLAKPDSVAAAGERAAFDETIAATARRSLYTSKRTGAAITSLALQVEAVNVAAALRKTVLRIYFDGAPNAQVEAPLGDFFGAGPGINPYATVPMTVAPDGVMTCRFVMPFAKEVRIEAENWSEASVRIRGAAGISAYTWDERRSMHFYAHWRADHGLIAGRAGEKADLPYLCARGKGVFVGAAAILMNPTPVPTEYGGWWGEGDEKIWVDDDTLPTTFGTGSEDYFNYAWSTPELFTYAYFAQPITTGPGNRGYVTNNRWHIIDPLPFTTGIFFFMELYPHRETAGLSYARITYYYAFPTIRDDRVPLRPDVLRIPPLPDWLPVADFGARGATFFQAEGLTATTTGGTVMRREDAMWAGGSLLWWHGHGPEDVLEITLPAVEHGKYRLALTLANSPECDHIALSLDGKPMFRNGRPARVFSPHLTISRSALGDQIYELAGGEHRLRIKAVDATGTGVANPVGIDFVWVQKR